MLCHIIVFYYTILQGSLLVNNLYPSDVYMVSGDGCTLLMKAVLGNHPMLVRALVNNKLCPIDFKQMRVSYDKILLAVI